MPSDKAIKFYDLQMDIFCKQRDKLTENIDDHLDLFDGNKKSDKDDFFRINEISEINKKLIEFNKKLEKSISNWKKFKLVEKENYLDITLPLEFQQDKN